MMFFSSGEGSTEMFYLSNSCTLRSMQCFTLSAQIQTRCHGIASGQTTTMLTTVFNKGKGKT